MRPIGFSTGAVSKCDYRWAICQLVKYNVEVVELSALRLKELLPLIQDFHNCPWRDFKFVSFHAPSHFELVDEALVLDCLRVVVGCGIPVVVHPDVIFTPSKWRWIGSLLYIENMDKRKPLGRTQQELLPLFEEFPAARLCFDIGHSRQVDPTMMEARKILQCFGDRLGEIHISEVNTRSHHDPISLYAMKAFQSVAHLIPDEVPVVLETTLATGKSDVVREISRARSALSSQFLDRVFLYGSDMSGTDGRQLSK